MRFVVRMTVIVAVALSVTCAAAQQSKQAKIARAMQAAPPSIARNASIMDADGTMLREGTNGWHCMVAVGPGSTHPGCMDKVWMEFMNAVGKKAPFKTDKLGISYMLAGDDKVNNADPYDQKEDPGEVWVQEGPHMMVVVPDPAMLERMSDDPKNGGPYVMWKGTPYAHVMIPLGGQQARSQASSQPKRETGSRIKQ